MHKANTGRKAPDTMGARLRALRLDRGMTQEEVEARIGLRQTLLSRIELGRCGTRIDTLVQLAKLYGVSLDYVVCGESLAA